MFHVQYNTFLLLHLLCLTTNPTYMSWYTGVKCKYIFGARHVSSQVIAMPTCTIHGRFGSALYPLGMCAVLKTGPFLSDWSAPGIPSLRALQPSCLALEKFAQGIRQIHEIHKHMVIFSCKFCGNAWDPSLCYESHSAVCWILPSVAQCLGRKTEYSWKAL